MFILSEIEDDIRVEPRYLGLSPLEAVTAVIQRRYIDRVIPDLGLVVTLYDVGSIEGGFVYHSDGAAYLKARFRLVVFRPFVGEVMVGRIKSMSREGMKISMDHFFDDISVPDYAMQDPSEYDEVEKVWVWKLEGREGDDFVMEQGEEVRFRVRALKFSTKTIKSKQTTGDGALPGVESAGNQPPLEVIAEVNSDGLGLTSWWKEVAENIEEV